MAGTIFSLALSQRVDPNGRPESGWRLYLYTANSSIPVTAYKDSGLTAGLEQPNPLSADAYGMMPEFWLADGSYRARATSADGARTFFDLQNVLALGASSGSGGGGGSVDANAIFQTGDVMWAETAGTRAGWVRDNGRTIGSSTSGATERANADCQTLFQWLWNNFADSICPVPGGRGASGAADWAANKQITLPDKRGYIVGGLDDMGNSAAGRYANVPVASGSVTTAGSVLGEATHALTEAELPTITPAGSVSITGSGGGAVFGGSSATGSFAAGATPAPNTPTSVNGTFTGTPFGSGTTHNTVQKTVLGTFYRKL